MVFAVVDGSLGMEREGWPSCRGTPSSLLGLIGMLPMRPFVASWNIHISLHIVQLQVVLGTEPLLYALESYETPVNIACTSQP